MLSLLSCSVSNERSFNTKVTVKPFWCNVEFELPTFLQNMSLHSRVPNWATFHYENTARLDFISLVTRYLTVSK